MIKAVDLRRGIAVRYRDDLWTVVDSTHVAKGNKRSLMQIKLKNLASGAIFEERFRVSDTLEDIYVDKRQMEYSYSSAQGHFCMDTQTYEQVPIALEVLPIELAKPMPTEKNPDRTLLEKHLRDYTQKNTADYFIHKDLGGFLSRELDFYIKNEVMNLDDVQNVTTFQAIEKQLRMIQILRAITLDRSTATTTI